MTWQTMILDPCASSFPQKQWRALAHRPGDGHILQDDRWGCLKQRFGWTPQVVALLNPAAKTFGAGVLLLFRTLPGGFTIAYAPKGPLWNWADRVQQQTLLAAIDQLARQRHAIMLKMEPEQEESAAAARRWHDIGFRRAPRAVQPRATIQVDLTPSEAEILARMKQKWRYNIRLAARKGVQIRSAAAADLPAFYTLMAETAQRDDFALHTLAYYQEAYKLFVDSGAARLFLATYEGNILAGLFAFVAGDRGYYMYGASGGRERQRMPNHLLQWEAMRWAKAQGAAIYDLWGIPAAAGRGATEGKGGLWGVYRFKVGFGGRVVYYSGCWDRVYKPLLYRAYLLWEKRRGGHGQ